LTASGNQHPQTSSGTQVAHQHCPIFRMIKSIYRLAFGYFIVYVQPSRCYCSFSTTRVFILCDLGVQFPTTRVFNVNDICTLRKFGHYNLPETFNIANLTMKITGNINGKELKSPQNMIGGVCQNRKIYLDRRLLKLADFNVKTWNTNHIGVEA